MSNSNNQFLAIIKKRRSRLVLANKISLSETQLLNSLKEVIQHTPNAFDINTNYTVILLNKKHQWFWSLVSDKLKQIIDPGKFENTKKRLDLFENSYGTILFFINKKQVQKCEKNFPLYKDNCWNWAMQQHGILMYACWLLFQSYDLGANIQHYGNLVSKEVLEKLKLSNDYELVGQMPFGSIKAVDQDKTLEDLKKIFKVLR